MVTNKIMNLPSFDKCTIAVLGLGYVGLPLCLRMINKRIKVVGVDNDKKKIKNLHRGISYISDIKNSDLPPKGL